MKDNLSIASSFCVLSIDSTGEAALETEYPLILPNISFATIIWYY